MLSQFIYQPLFGRLIDAFTNSSLLERPRQLFTVLFQHQRTLSDRLPPAHALITDRIVMPDDWQGGLGVGIGLVCEDCVPVLVRNDPNMLPTPATPHHGVLYHIAVLRVILLVKVVATAP